MPYAKIIALLFFVVFLSNIGSAVATDQIMITKSFTMDQAVFDGKWSFYMEWKKSSWDPLSYSDGTLIHLRTAHQGNFIYVFMDDVETTQWNSGSDRATVCFDTDNSKSVNADSNDYCFVTTLSESNSITLQGGSPLASTSHFRTIANPGGFIGIASISDENDRYTIIPHPSYEFRIPTDVIGRSSDYGFYVSVYHAQTNKIYSWPQNASTSSYPLEIPSPSKWGELISPDKSIPEFPIPAVTLLISMVVLVYFSRNVWVKRFG
ncbi:MAG: hypothetical protein ACREBA_08680 [Nitrosotalea sp.]